MIDKILREIKPFGATLVAVSKTKPISAIMHIYAQGIRDFGENRVQELVEKHESLPKDIQWHMIGTLQKNKVKYLVPFIHLIHSVDSIELLDTIQKEAAKIGRKVPVLLQIYIAKEETKQGFGAPEFQNFVQNKSPLSYPNIVFKGVMGMASFSDDQNLVRSEFKTLKSLFESTRPTMSPEFDIISMGMSGDYAIALEEGSTMIRVGSAIFGSR
jgi:PLP dependent protein